MLHHVALIRSDVSEVNIASIIRVTRIGELRTTLAITNNRKVVLPGMLRLSITVNVVPSSPILVTLVMESIIYSKMSVLAIASRHNIPKDGIPYSQRSKNLKSYTALTGWAL
jgi:hypothetical protein